MNPKDRIEQLQKELTHAQYLYYVKDAPTMSDFEYEFQRALLMKKVEPRIETVFIMTSTKYSYISSTGIRELACFGGKLDDMVPDYVEKKLKVKFADKYNA